MILEAKTMAGVWVRFNFEDKGYDIPGLDSAGNRYEAKTYWLRICNGSSIPGLTPVYAGIDRAADVEDYLQIRHDRIELAVSAASADEFVANELRKFFVRIGLEPSSVCVPLGMQGVKGYAEMAEFIDRLRSAPT
jgi:hypothetical protein